MITIIQNSGYTDQNARKKWELGWISLGLGSAVGEKAKQLRSEASRAEVWGGWRSSVALSPPQSTAFIPVSPPFCAFSPTRKLGPRLGWIFSFTSTQDIIHVDDGTKAKTGSINKQMKNCKQRALEKAPKLSTRLQKNEKNRRKFGEHLNLEVKKRRTECYFIRAS